MFRITNQGIFIFLIAVFILLLYLLAPILTPFLLGALLAYLIDPLVKRLEKFHLPHLLSVIAAFSLLMFVILALIFMLVPMIQKQLFVLINAMPAIFTGIPKAIRPTAIKLAKQCNDVLGEFLRGQLLVMVALALIYGIGLSLIGLQLGLTIGIVGGLLTIVPYLGSIFVLTASSIAALVQFGTADALIPVVIVFLIGQGMESYVLSPYLIGNRIGLHPVAVIFSILAFGTLFGFFGVLLALPASAVIIVLFRFLRQKYAHAA